MLRATQGRRDQVATARAELDKETQDIEVRELSALGKRLATAFANPYEALIM
jgi:hypothetical protein